MTDNVTTYDDVIRKITALDACGLGIGELKDELIDALGEQESSYRRAGMDTGCKDRAEKVISVILRRFRVPSAAPGEDRGGPPGPAGGPTVRRP